MNPKELMELAKKNLAEGKEFKFWRLIEELEKTGPEINDSRKGKIEENVRVEGALWLEEGAVVKSGSRIEGNVFIGKNSVIGPNAFMRKNVVVGENCQVSNSEIKNSIILGNSKVPHFSYIGDSIIGENVNFGAGSKIANLRFDDKSIKVKVNGETVDSGRRKLGACINSGTKIGINACINCGAIIGKNCQIHPGAAVKENLAGGAIKEN